MAEQEKPKLTREERIQAMKDEALLQQKLAREDKLSGYLRQLREAAAKEDPDWDVLL